MWVHSQVTMTGPEVMDALIALRLSPGEAAREFGVSERTIRRWETSGVDGAPVAMLEYAVRLDRLGIAWRRGAISISLQSGGVVQLTDHEAVARHATIKDW